MDSRGYTLIEIAIALSVGAIITAGSFVLYKAERLQGDIEVTRKNAEQLLFAGQAYWSATRAFPTSVGALVSAGYVGGSVVPPNPLGGAFTITGETVGASTPVIIVRATVTRGGSDADMVKVLNANKVAAGGGVEWRRIAAETNSASQANTEAFRGMY